MVSSGITLIYIHVIKLKSHPTPQSKNTINLIPYTFPIFKCIYP